MRRKNLFCLAVGLVILTLLCDQLAAAPKKLITVDVTGMGMSRDEAIIQAGMTRFRPVILTAVTTILGLIPLTTGMSLDFNALVHGRMGDVLLIGGESSQWWGPMGVAVIWGLAVATFLTLVVVPVMYSALDPIKRFIYLVLVGWWRRSPADPGA